MPIIKNIIAATTSDIHDSAWKLLKAWSDLKKENEIGSKQGVSSGI